MKERRSDKLPRKRASDSEPEGRPSRGDESGRNPPKTKGKVTKILAQLAAGDTSVKDELWEEVYQQLHRRAKQMLYDRGASLRPTELVQEAYLKFEGQRKTPVDRTHFQAIAATLMYRVLMDHLESRGRRKQMFVTLEGHERSGSSVNVDALALRQAMERLKAEDPRGAEIAVYRYFGEMTVRQIAEMLDLSERQVYRLWRLARAQLLRDLKPLGGNV